MISLPCHIDISWQLEAPVDTIWSPIIEVQHWPQWWDAVQQVTVLETGNAEGLGCIFQVTWDVPLPFPIVSESQVSQVVTPQLFEHKSEGPMTSVVQWQLMPTDWGTIVCFGWEIMALTWAARAVLSPFPKSMFEDILFATLKTGGLGLAEHFNIPIRSVDRGDARRCFR